MPYIDAIPEVISEFSSRVEAVEDREPTYIDDWLTQRPLRRLLAHWQDRRGHSPWPSRTDIDPVDLKDLLGWLMLIEREGDDFRYRLVGSKIVEITQLDATGQTLGALPEADYYAMVRSNCRLVVETGMPNASRYHHTLNGRTARFERLELPLGPLGRAPDMILVGMVPVARIGGAAPTTTYRAI